MTSQQSDLVETALYLCRRTDRLLWETYEASEHRGSLCSTRLRFPTRSGEENDRLSEQEARTLFCHVIETSKKGDFPYLYCVEVPTFLAYGKQRVRSGLSDLTLIEPSDAFVPLLNIEFKYGGVMANNKRFDEIVTKDMKKLLGEKASGLWFHVVKKQARDGVAKQLRAWQTGVEKAVHEFGRQSYLPPKQLIFHLCCLEQPFSLTKILDFTGAAPFFPEDFFSLVVSGGPRLTHKHFGDASQMNNWERHKP